MNNKKDLLWGLCLELATGKVQTVKEPVKLKKLQLDDDGKKLGEYEVVEMVKRQQFVPPQKEALELLCQMLMREEPQAFTHSVPRPDEE